jgi:hypothetical protein
MGYRWLFHPEGGILSSQRRKARPMATGRGSERIPLASARKSSAPALQAPLGISAAMVSVALKRNWRILGAGALLVALGGCTISTTNHGWPGAYAPTGVVNAQDCVEFSFGQPSKFACRDGKVYTSWQLKELREKAVNPAVASTY